MTGQAGPAYVTWNHVSDHVSLRQFVRKSLRPAQRRPELEPSVRACGRVPGWL